ncbi:MAG: hypothetical protein QGH51_08290 [Planctomycetota bacterium]|nr:hypothetical protein [Planctomycetota bacterium]MDP6942007.1 hypothetical protein [Planctomycetota bacterium]
MNDCDVCCPPFDSAPWSDATVEWKDKNFLQNRARGFLHIPIGFGKVMVRNMERLQSANRSHALPKLHSSKMQAEN